MSFTQAQIDATAKELHRRESAGSAGTGERWEDYRDVARKALEAGHVGVPATEGAAIQAARDTFARWQNGDGSEQELAGALHGLIESYSPAPEVEEALELLDTLNESGRMRYDDYAELHGIVSRLAPTEPMNPTDDQVTAAIRIYRNRDPKAFAAEWMPDVLRSVL